jgi:excisionase family DNA binding protein
MTTTATRYDRAALRQDRTAQSTAAGAALPAVRHATQAIAKTVVLARVSPVRDTCAPITTGVLVEGRIMTERLAYRVPEAAQVLGISERSAWKLVRDGELQVVRSGKIVLVPRIALEAFLQRGLEAQKTAEVPLPSWLQPMVRGGRRHR